VIQARKPRSRRLTRDLKTAIPMPLQLCVGQVSGSADEWQNGLEAKTLKEKVRTEMPASLKRTRESMSVKPTARNKGLTLTITVTAYDNGMVQVDGIPINNSDNGYDQADGWQGAGEVTMATLNEFRRQSAARRQIPGAAATT
jgi:hypothetical protein